MSNRALLYVAGALALVSLGLPWGQTAPTPGTVMGGGSRISVNDDGTFDVLFTPTTYLPGLAGSTTVGAEHTMRVAGAAGALLVFLGERRRHRRLVVAGLLIAAVALPIGLTAGSASGRVAYGLAIGLAALSLLRRPNPPAAATSP